MIFVVTDYDEWEHAARRLRMRHDNHFYGPMKGATCGCEVCTWAQRFLDLFEVLRDQSDRGE